MARHAPKILAADELFVQLFSEPSAGSDMAGIMTRAERDGDDWVITGSKIWTSGAQYSDYGMCLARTNWDAPKHRGLTWFAVPLRAEVVGTPTVRLDRNISAPPGYTGDHMAVASAMSVVNAIPRVCAAPPGVLSLLDVPPFPSRNAV